MLERHQFLQRASEVNLCLLTAKLLTDLIEVAAEGGHGGVVGANSGLGDL
jgi:hypothetical protein